MSTCHLPEDMEEGLALAGREGHRAERGAPRQGLSTAEGRGWGQRPTSRIHHEDGYDPVTVAW